MEAKSKEDTPPKSDESNTIVETEQAKITPGRREIYLKEIEKVAIVKRWIDYKMACAFGEESAAIDLEALDCDFSTTNDILTPDYVTNYCARQVVARSEMLVDGLNTYLEESDLYEIVLDDECDDHIECRVDGEVHVASINFRDFLTSQEYATILEEILHFARCSEVSAWFAVVQEANLHLWDLEGLRPCAFDCGFWD